MGRSLFEKNVHVDKYNKLWKFRIKGTQGPGDGSVTLATKLETFSVAKSGILSRDLGIF